MRIFIETQTCVCGWRWIFDVRSDNFSFFSRVLLNFIQRKLQIKKNFVFFFFGTQSKPLAKAQRYKKSMVTVDQSDFPKVVENKREKASLSKGKATLDCFLASDIAETVHTGGWEREREIRIGYLCPWWFVFGLVGGRFRFLRGLVNWRCATGV